MPVTDDLCRSFLDLWWQFNPAAATRSGLSEHDGRLGSFDAEAVRVHVAALRSIAGAVEELDVARVTDATMVQAARISVTSARLRVRCRL